MSFVTDPNHPDNPSSTDSTLNVSQDDRLSPADPTAPQGHLPSEVGQDIHAAANALGEYLEQVFQALESLGHSVVTYRSLLLSIQNLSKDLP